MQPDNIITQTAPNGPMANGQTTTQNTPRLTNRQLALTIGRLAISSILLGDPDPRTFDRTALRLAAAVLAELLAETETEVAP